MDDLEVVPTRVGVNRCRESAWLTSQRCPHARGGEPLHVCFKISYQELSPRAWG